MRIPKKFGELTITPRQLKRKYFLVFEGTKTEVQYFNGIIDNRDELGVNSLIELTPLLRSYNEENWSNPKKILLMLIEYLENSVKQNLTVDLFVDRVADWMLEEDIINANGIYNKESFKTGGVKHFIEDGYLPSDIIKLDIACKIIVSFLTCDINIADAMTSINEYVNSQRIVYDPETDKVCLITDRDKQCFKSQQYDFVLKTCEEKRYSFYVTNPCFEFWLLLHFDEVLQMNKDDLLNNPKETTKAKKRFLEKQLSVLMDGYKKEHLNFDKFKNRINNALSNETHFCEDIGKLKNELGCNIGKLIGEIRQI